ncbi:hypothetical protein GPJ56_009275 [Histomonas meleagridis]|uniref:uncharacterized protein n=1 Tax=Histomonas meleagridis TaxID=135588 RepID=UPI003559559F|nr:hypothetical protein GPJ56_009275 [Histomonas meleagridis]KAH0801646.1 hypothetical protein GO595_005645 [Histomonas meleagridis]
METREFSYNFQNEDLYIEEVSFGKSRYIYIGDKSRQFNDLSMAMPNPVTSTHLLGDKPSDELTSFISDLTKSPILLSYSFPLDNESDLHRFDFVKSKLRAIYSTQK